MSSEVPKNQEVKATVRPSKVIAPRELLGFCEGVRRSKNVYRDAVENLEDGQDLYSVGEPAHNDRLNDWFKARDVKFVKHVSEIPTDDGRKKKVLFGPHGSTEEDMSIAIENGFEVTDTVCPLVTKPLKEIKNHTQNGGTVFYNGHIEGNGEMHPETRAALAAGGENIFLVISNKDDFTDEQLREVPAPVISIGEMFSAEVILGLPDPSKIAFISQTTHNADEVKEIGEGLKFNLPELILPKVTDVCYATRNRQNVLSKMIDMGAEKVVVVTSGHSSNGRNLGKKSEEKGASVQLVNGAGEIDHALFDGYDGLVAVTGAASTEDDAIIEVIDSFVERGSEGPELIDLYDDSGEVISESRITFPPPRTIKPKKSA